MKIECHKTQMNESTLLFLTFSPSKNYPFLKVPHDRTDSNGTKIAAFCFHPKSQDKERDTDSLLILVYAKDENALLILIILKVTNFEPK